jgi:hypothetical protein
LVVSRRRLLEAAFVLLEFRSPSRRIFIGSHSLPPSLVRRIGPSAAYPGASARRATRHTARRRLLRLAQARRRLLHLRRAFGCFGTSRGLSRDSSLTTSPHAGSSSNTSPPPRVRVPQHVARLVTRLVVDYFALHRLVVDYFTYAARPVASAHRAACRAARHAARHRLLHLAQAHHRLLHRHRTSGCFGTSCGLSRY